MPDWLKNATPTVDVPGVAQVTVARYPGSSAQLANVVAGKAAPGLPSLADVLSQTDYTLFATGLEEIHDQVHVWVGGSQHNPGGEPADRNDPEGTMAQIPIAPADPIFWMHHANIDRLWWSWQNSQAGQNQHPNLAGRNAIMDPWRFSSVDAQTLAPFSYTYK